MDPNVKTGLIVHKNCGGILIHEGYNFRECWNCEQYFIIPQLPYKPVDCPDCVAANE